MRRLWYHGKVDTMVPGKDRQQALSLEEGLSLFTSRAAWASRDEEVRGRLMPGMQGDLVILDGDLFAVLPQELPKVLVFETVLAGETVFAKKV